MPQVKLIKVTRHQLVTLTIPDDEVGLYRERDLEDFAVQAALKSDVGDFSGPVAAVEDYVGPPEYRPELTYQVSEPQFRIKAAVPMRPSTRGLAV